MSITPTEEALHVAFDFEGTLTFPPASIPRNLCPGVHGNERSPQEDVLLVLFASAISNLVCIGIGLD